MSEKKKSIPEDDTKGEIIGEVGRGALATTGLFFLELVKVIVLAGITIALVRYFLFKPFYVQGQSMEPNFFEKEYLIIDEITYRFREPERGEVIVFHPPLGERDFYLKRIVGLPGETIKVDNNKVVVFNTDHPQGVVVEEGYLTEPTPGSVTIELGEHQYFVLGDNRDESFDSRRFGPVDRDLIIGRTWLRGWPFTRVGIINSPLYNL